MQRKNIISSKLGEMLDSMNYTELIQLKRNTLSTTKLKSNCKK